MKMPASYGHAPRLGFSLLRLSVPTRLAIVGTIAALLWVLVWLWALA